MALWSRDSVKSHDKSNHYAMSISTTTMSMTTKLRRMVTYIEGLLPVKQHDLLTIWCFDITSQIKNIMSSLPQWLWPPNLVVTYNEEFPLTSSSHITHNSQVTSSFNHVVSLCHVTNSIRYFSTCIRPILIKHSNMFDLP